MCEYWTLKSTRLRGQVVVFLKICFKVSNVTASNCPFLVAVLCKATHTLTSCADHPLILHAAVCTSITPRVAKLARILTRCRPAPKASGVAICFYPRLSPAPGVEEGEWGASLESGGRIQPPSAPDRVEAPGDLSEIRARSRAWKAHEIGRVPPPPIPTICGWDE